MVLYILNGIVSNSCKKVAKKVAVFLSKLYQNVLTKNTPIAEVLYLILTGTILSVQYVAEGFVEFLHHITV